MTKDLQNLSKDIATTLDESLEMDSTTQDRLAEIRTRALTGIPEASQSSNYARLWWGAASATAVALFFVTMFVVHPSKVPSESSEILAFEWVLSETEPELLLSDLEFYEWAAENEQNPG